MIERYAFLLVEVNNLQAERLSAIRCCHNYEIIASDMTYKIIQVPVFAHHLLTNAAYQANNIVAGQEAIDVVKRFEVIQVQIKDAPRIQAVQFILNRQFYL